MEEDSAALAAIRANVAHLKEETRADVLRADACHPPRAREAATLLLMDPPYGKGMAAPALAALAQAGWLAPEALAVAEVAARDDFAPPPGFATVDERRIGDGRLVFLRFRPAPSSG
jgi:16S rRNA (guanine966-N2)-methyltransferase